MNSTDPKNHAQLEFRNSFGLFGSFGLFCGSIRLGFNNLNVKIVAKYKKIVVDSYMKTRFNGNQIENGRSKRWHGRKAEKSNRNRAISVLYSTR